MEFLFPSDLSKIRRLLRQVRSKVAAVDDVVYDPHHQTDASMLMAATPLKEVENKPSSSAYVMGDKAYKIHAPFQPTRLHTYGSRRNKSLHSATNNKKRRGRPSLSASLTSLSSIKVITLLEYPASSCDCLPSRIRPCVLQFLDFIAETLDRLGYHEVNHFHRQFDQSVQHRGLGLVDLAAYAHAMNLPLFLDEDGDHEIEEACYEATPTFGRRALLLEHVFLIIVNVIECSAILEGMLALFFRRGLTHQAFAILGILFQNCALKRVSDYKNFDELAKALGKLNNWRAQIIHHLSPDELQRSAFSDYISSLHESDASLLLHDCIIKLVSCHPSIEFYPRTTKQVSKWVDLMLTFIYQKSQQDGRIKVYLQVLLELSLYPGRIPLRKDLQVAMYHTLCSNIIKQRPDMMLISPHCHKVMPHLLKKLESSLKTSWKNATRYLFNLYGGDLPALLSLVDRYITFQAQHVAKILIKSMMLNYERLRTLSGQGLTRIVYQEETVDFPYLMKRLDDLGGVVEEEEQESNELVDESESDCHSDVFVEPDPLHLVASPVDGFEDESDQENRPKRVKRGLSINKPFHPFSSPNMQSPFIANLFSSPALVPSRALFLESDDRSSPCQKQFHNPLALPTSELDPVVSDEEGEFIVKVGKPLPTTVYVDEESDDDDCPI